MPRPNIRNQSLLYQITDIDNLNSILEEGLKPRCDLVKFSDVADREILEGRSRHGLDQKVPFHFFANNPFDGRVQIDHPEKEFVILTVHRSLASRRNWEIIPQHPLGIGDYKILNYADGIEAIDWELMNLRDYNNSQSKSVCMAECLAPGTVSPDVIFSIYVRDQGVQERVLMLCDSHDVTPHVNINPSFFR